MKKEKEGKKKNQQWMVVFVYLVMGALCGVIGMIYMEGIIGEDKGVWVPLLGTIVTMAELFFVLFVHIIIHEAGHLVFGLVSGYRFSSFRVGNLMWIKKKEGLQLKKFSLAGTGGQCLMVPPEGDWREIPYRLYNFGGVLFNLGFSAVSAVLLYVINFSKPVEMGIVFFLIVGMGAAIANGVPIYGQINNDGANALSLGKNPKALQAFAHQLRVNAEITQEVRLKDMPKEWFWLPKQEDMERDSLCSAIGVMAFQRALDEHDFYRAKEIGAQLEALGENLISIYQNLLINDLVFLELISEETMWEENKEKRESLFKKMEKKEYTQFVAAMKNYPSILRTQYALALLKEKQETKAKKILTKFEQVAKTYPHQCEIEGEREFLRMVEKTVL